MIVALIAAWYLGILVFVGEAFHAIPVGKFGGTVCFLFVVMVSILSVLAWRTLGKIRALRAKRKFDRQAGIL
jgi:hypothetical protein